MTEFANLDELVRASLAYDQDTGVITWNDRPWVRGCVNHRVRWKAAGSTFDGYNRIKIHKDGNTIYLLGHRVAWFLTYRAWPIFELDHKDGNGLNNRIDNLREVTSQENKFNTRPKGGTSRFKGVMFDIRRDKFHAAITFNKRNRFLGYFDSEYDAARAYDTASLSYFGEHAKTNAMMGLL